MKFALITDDAVVSWDGGKVSGIPVAAASDAEDALRRAHEVVGATPTGPFFAAGTPEHAWLVLRTLAPYADVAGDVPDFGDLGDELPRDVVSGERRTNGSVAGLAEAFVERLHPRDRKGRWRDVPDYVKSLKLSGVHLVGGAVRDELLGQPHKDADFLVLGHDTDDIRQTLEPHGRVEDLVVADKPVGVRFYPHDTDARDLAPDGIEFVPPRTERSTGSGHKDFEIVADKTVPFDEDARRRDFTVNAIAQDIETGALLDPLDGAEDARAGLLRVIGPRSFQEDPLRIIRGLRFISQHDLDPTPETLEQMREHAPGVEHLSGERIGGEMDKLLMGRNPAKSLRIARDTGVLPYLLPELAPTLGFDQGSKYHGLTADEHTFEVVQSMADQGVPLTVRWAGLLHDSGKPESAWLGGDGRLHYYANEEQGKRGHEEIGAEKARSALNRFAHLERDDRDRVIRIVREHMFRDHDSPKEIKARQFLAKHGEALALDLLDMKRADIAGKESDDDERITAELGKLARFQETVEGQLAAGVPYRIKDLAITGHDLIALGYTPGPALGQALEHLKQQVIGNSSLNTPDWLRAEAARRLRKGAASPGGERPSRETYPLSPAEMTTIVPVDWQVEHGYGHWVPNAGFRHIPYVSRPGGMHDKDALRMMHHYFTGKPDEWLGTGKGSKAQREEIEREAAERWFAHMEREGWMFVPEHETRQNPLVSLNPTGGVFADYNPAARATAPLGADLMTLDLTMGVDPDTPVTIYRGAPTHQREIAPGDFVTTNPQLARDYGEHVISKQVPASDVLDDWSEPLGEEYIYRPDVFAGAASPGGERLPAREPEMATRVAGSYAEAAQIVTDGLSRKLERDLESDIRKVREWWPGEDGDTLYLDGPMYVHNITQESGGDWAVGSHLLDYPANYQRSLRSLDEMVEKMRAMTDEHKAGLLPAQRKVLRGIIEKNAGTGKLAYANARRAVAENSDADRYARLRERWRIPDDLILISEAGYGKFGSGIEDVFVTASRDARRAGHTSVNALALIVDEKDGPEARASYRTRYLEPGVGHATMASTAALLRHEWAHSVWEEMSDRQQQAFVDQLPGSWEEVAAGLSAYAAGSEETRAEYERNNERPVPRYYTETFAEAVALTTGNDFEPEKWPQWVSGLRDFIDGLAPEER